MILSRKAEPDGLCPATGYSPGGRANLAVSRADTVRHWSQFRAAKKRRKEVSQMCRTMIGISALKEHGS
jgi:hypothetical protein